MRRSSFLPLALLPAVLILVIAGCSGTTSGSKSGGGGPTPPSITSFTASPATINSGSSASLTWAATGATSISIAPGSFTSTAASGSTTVSPSVTTTYTLTATNASGSVTATAIVAVSAPPRSPVITSFTANPSSISTGATSTLNWSTTGATSIAITPGSFSSTFPSGSLNVTPSATTTFTLTATNTAGSVTATATVTVSSATASACGSMSTGIGASFGGFVPFPANNPWNTDISAAALDPNSSSIMNYIGLSAPLHPDFGSFAGYGIPYIIVDSTTTPLVRINLADSSESDFMPMPFPANAPIEGAGSAGDQHVLVVDKNTCWLYEVWLGAVSGGQWSANNSAVWDLQNYNSRPYTWTSADAAGLPILPGLIRYDEVASGAINHAIRFTVPRTWAAFVSPATHWAATNSGSPIPMGMRIRLKAGKDISTFSAANKVILAAMKKYGLVMADNGSAMYITGAPDSRWDDNDLHNLGSITAADFEVVQMPTEIHSGNVLLGAAPVINSFTASAATASAGTPVTLSWDTTGASYLFINPSAGASVGVVRGTSILINPSVTATYTLNATNSFGRTTATVTVTVH